VGFGFGPIQSGLFLYEAYLSGNFDRYVISEVDQALVDAVVANGGRCNVNIARKDRIDEFVLKGIELLNPREPLSRDRIVNAIAQSDELATALPSVNIYDAGGQASVVSLLLAGVGRRDRAMPTVLYTAENNNRAAEILEKKLLELSFGTALAGFQALNTVVGKMSGIITDPKVISRLDLATMTPDIPRAILIEEFNCILISRIVLPGYRRGIDVFEEKGDLLPFEEAKLYGHNAAHAVIGYLAELKGHKTIAEAGRDNEIMSVARKAFIEECGAGLIHRNAATGDPLFTPGGFRDYAEDLLERMTCSNLNDLVSRVCRDHIRKLGYGDRLFGAMRLALEAGVEPVNLARGAAAGVISMALHRDDLGSLSARLPSSGGDLTQTTLTNVFRELWSKIEDGHANDLIQLTWEAVTQLC